MAKRIIFDRIVEIGELPWNVKALGFHDADEISRIANKFGKIVCPMSLSDVVEAFESRTYNK